jgi:hypothetical protein
VELLRIVSQTGSLSMALSYDSAALSYQQYSNLPPRFIPAPLNFSLFNLSSFNVSNVTKQQNVTCGNATNCTIRGPASVLNFSRWYGFIFGEYDLTPAFSVRESACEATVWISQSAVGCKNSLSYFSSRHAVLTVTEIPASLSSLLSYDHPRLSGPPLPPDKNNSNTSYSNYSFSPDFDYSNILGNNSNISLGMNTSASNSSHLLVNNSSQAAVNLSVSANSTFALNSSTFPGNNNSISNFSLGNYSHSNESITNFTHGYNDSAHKFNITGWENCSSVFRFRCSNSSAQTELTPFNLPATGSVMLSLFGQRFPLTDFTPTVRSGFSSSERTVWCSETGLSLKSAAAMSSSNIAIMSVGQQVSSVSDSVSFDLLSLSVFSPGNGPVRGGYSITASGAGFSTGDNSMSSRVGGCVAPYCEHSYTPSTQDPVTAWISDSSLVVRYLGGVQDRMTFVCSAAQLSNSVTLAFSYNGWPKVLSLAPPNTPPQSNEMDLTISRINILGSDLGTEATTVRATVGRTVCRSTTWLSSTTVQCHVASGVDFESNTGRWFDSDGQPLFKQSGPVNVVVFHCKGLDECHYYFRTSSNTLSWGFTYDSPSLSSVSRYDSAVIKSGNSRGSIQARSILITGASFSAYSFSAKARLAFTACTTTIWISDSDMIGLISTGQGSTAYLDVTLNMKFSTYSEVFTYDKPTTSASMHTNHPARSSTVISLGGSEFGILDMSPASGSGFSACQTTRWASSTSLTCNTPTGQRASLLMKLTAAMKLGTLTIVFSVDALSVADVVKPNSPSTGAVSVSVIGAGFDLKDHTPNVRYSDTAAKATQWVSDSRVTALTASAVKGNFMNTLTAGAVPGTASALFTWDMPNIVRIEPSNAGQSFLPARNLTFSWKSDIGASNLAQWDASVKAGIGFSACEFSEWRSTTSIFCKPQTSGYAYTLGIFLTGFSHTLSTQTAAFSFIMPHASQQFVTNSPVKGQITSVVGINLGVIFPTLHLRTAMTSSQSTNWISESSLSSRFSGGLQSTRLMAITLGIKVGTLTDTSSVDTSAISSIKKSNGSPTGSFSVTLTGKSFGTFALSNGARTGSSAAENTYWISDTSLGTQGASGISRIVGRFVEYGGVILPSVLSSAQSQIICTAGRSVGSISEGFTYKWQPSLSAGRKANFPVEREFRSSIIVFGLGFANSDWTNRCRVRLTGAESSFWFSDTAVLTMISDGTWNYLGAAVTIGILKGTVSNAFSFDGDWPYLTTVDAQTPPLTNTLWRNNSYLVGFSFGSVSCSPKARIGGSACTSTTWMAWSSVKCNIAAGRGAYLNSVLTVGVCSNATKAVAKAYVSSLSASFSYDDPLLSSSFPFNRMGTQQTMTVFGANFGRADITLAFRTGSTSCESTKWRSASSLNCAVSSGLSGTLDMAVTVAKMLVEHWVDQDNEMFFDIGWILSFPSIGKGYSYDTPSIGPRFRNESSAVLNGSNYSINPMSPYNLPTTVIVTSILYGSGYGVSDGSAAVSTGNTECPFTQWQSTTAVYVTSGIGGFGPTGSKAVSVTLGQRIGSMSSIWSFDTPDLDLVFSFPGPATTSKGNFIQQTMNIWGSRFMPSNPSATARVQLTRCQVSTWFSDTSTTCLLPRGIAGYNVFSVTSGERSGTWTPSTRQSYTYYRILLQIQSSGGQIVPGFSLTVLGVGFGINDYTTRMRLGLTACEVTSWTSDTTTTCLVPGGALRPDRVTSTVAGLENFWVPIYVSCVNKAIVSVSVCLSVCRSVVLFF